MEKEILQAILNLVNQGHTVRFEGDWGENSITLFIDDKHSHCGDCDGDFGLLVKDIHNLLVNGHGLSFV